MFYNKKRMCLSIKFRLRNQNHNPKTGLTPLYCRISLNSVYCDDFFTGVRCVPQKWNNDKQKIVGIGNDVLELNNTLKNVFAELQRVANNLNEHETVNDIKKRFLAKDVPPPTLFEVFGIYIKDEKEVYGGTDKALSKKTIEKWYYSLNHLKSYCKNDVRLFEINRTFANKYYKYLIQKMSNNHAIRNLSYLKSVIDYAVHESFVKENNISLRGFKKDSAKDIKYLSNDELLKIETLPRNGVFSEIIDLFLLTCYTSLDNNELQRVENEVNIKKDYITINRGKVKDSVQIIPILPKTRLLLEKYKYELPKHPTYTINRYLDVVEKMLNLPYNLTTKTGRKTAGMFFLSNKVALEVVSRILGHSSITTTQRHYANILNKDLILERTKHLM